MTAILTLTTAGTDLGPFDLYSNLDVFAVPFETGVSRDDLILGYLSIVVPDFTTIVRVKSTGICVNHIDIPLTINTHMFSLARGISVEDACLNANSL